jgi:lysophospholipase L1-like esterase
MLDIQRVVWLVVFVISGVLWADPSPDRWEAEIARLEASDRDQPPVAGGIVFAGSSSIRLWDLPRSFPGLKAANKGFGGSSIADNTRYAQRLILPWKPARIVFYAGDNDIASGRSPENVAADFKEFAGLIHAALPDCRIHFISIKPSPARWKFWPQAREANRLIKEFCQADERKRLVFVDIVPTLLGSDGQPHIEFFRDDKLHLNDAGYAEWTKVINLALGRKLETSAR